MEDSELQGLFFPNRDDPAEQYLELLRQARDSGWYEQAEAVVQSISGGCSEIATDQLAVTFQRLSDIETALVENRDLINQLLDRT
jgi:hypothetical protein